MNNSIRFFSLFAPDSEQKYFRLNDNTINDLSIDFLALNLAETTDEQSRLKQMLYNMPVSRDIIEYRQEIYKDLKDFPDVCNELCEIFDRMNFYTQENIRNLNEKSSIWELVARLRSLQNYVDSVSQLQKLLKDKNFTSRGMKTLYEHIERIHSEGGFSELEKDLEAIGEDVNSIHSMTLGVNFDSNFFPHEVGILSLNNYYFGEKGMLERFFKFHKKGNSEDTDLTPFTMLTHPKVLSADTSPLMNNLTRLVEQMLPTATKKILRVLKKYTDISASAIAGCADELMFYIRFINLEKKLTENNLPCCMPEFSDNDTVFSDVYNVKLAIHSINTVAENATVCNDLHFTKDDNILILTGPNRGGKTIITQGIGLAVLMFQLGVFVPCRSGKIKLCDGIYTHFPADENQTVTLGRLGEESERFSNICKIASSDSLLLFNESFATTSHNESLYIAEDVIKYLTCLGARACFNTHLHELAENIENLSCDKSICGCASVVMGKRDSENAYKISYEKPDGKSYAHSIAYQYGITLDQLLENI